MKLRIIALSVVAALAVAVPATAGSPARSTTPVRSFADLSILGTSTLHPHGTNDYPSIGQEIQHFGCGACPDQSLAPHEVGS